MKPAFIARCLPLLIGLASNHRCPGADGTTPAGTPVQRAATANSRIDAYNHLQAGRWNEAWRGFQQASERESTNSRELPIRRVRPGASGLCSTLAAADSLARSGRYPEATQLLDALIAAKPGSTLPHDLKAMIQIREKDLPGAMTTLKTAPLVEGATAHTLLLRSYVLVQQGQLTNSLECLNGHWNELEDCFLAWNLRGCIDVVEGRLGDALRDFARAQELNPEFDVAQRNAASVARIRARRLFRASE